MHLQRQLIISSTTPFFMTLRLLLGLLTIMAYRPLPSNSDLYSFIIGWRRGYPWSCQSYSVNVNVASCSTGTPVTFEALKETFTAKGQAQYIDYLDNITRRGYWTLSTNYLAPNNSALRFGVPGKSAYSIQDAMLMQDYPPPIGANGKARAGIPTYPMTLLWYPESVWTQIRGSLSNVGWQMAEESLLPAKGSSPGFQRYSSPPRGPTAAAATPPEAAPSAFCTSQNSGKRQVKRKPTSVRSHRQSPAMNATTASFLGLRRRQ